jgi:hypothetical protein
LILCQQKHPGRKKCKVWQPCGQQMGHPSSICPYPLPLP